MLLSRVKKTMFRNKLDLINLMVACTMAIMPISAARAEGCNEEARLLIDLQFNTEFLWLFINKYPASACADRAKARIKYLNDEKTSPVGPFPAPHKTITSPIPADQVPQTKF
jgi:hypothetical protein